MSRPNTLAAIALSLLFIGCTAAGGAEDSQDLDPRRGPLGKADTTGTCQDACGGQSLDGNCWCDDQCEFYGDCCDDYTPTCTDEIQTCGGFGGFQCPEGEYCHYDEDLMCGAADHLGTCKPKPEACIEIFAPVCGCDGVTYTNECHAHGAGTSVASEGACEDGGEQLCLTDGDCESGEACDHSECHSPPCPDGMACPTVCYGVCSEDAEPEPTTCAGSCGGAAPAGCYCDELCTSYGDCCDDYEEVCTEQTCCDPAEQPGTNGNPFCIEGATCCADGTWSCNSGNGMPTCPQGLGTVCEA